jgi:FkbM family methyltransferase
MSIISYAQNFEDVMLWRALGHVENGFYIDIGAQDPVVDSVSLAFHARGWKGIHIEPTPHYAQLLREQRPGDTVIETAVGNGPEILTFFEIPDTGISTADPNIAEQHRERGFEIREITVPCVRLSSIFKACEERDIHWMKIDVEGFEFNALKSWGKAKARPWIVVVESTLPLTQIESYSQWEPLLLRRGYTPVYFDGLNRYYTCQEHAELKHAFYAPPNVFDAFSVNGTASSKIHQHLSVRHTAELADAKMNVQHAQTEITSLRELNAEREMRHEVQLQEHAVQLEAQKAATLLLDHSHRNEIADLQAEIVRASGLAISAKDQAASLIRLSQQEVVNSARAQAAREREFANQFALQEQAYREEISSLRAEAFRVGELLVSAKDTNAAALLVAQSETLRITRELAAYEREVANKFFLQEQNFRDALSVTQAEAANIAQRLAAERDQHVAILANVQKELIKAEKSELAAVERAHNAESRLEVRERELSEALNEMTNARSALQHATNREQGLLDELSVSKEAAIQLERAQVLVEEQFRTQFAQASKKIEGLQQRLLVIKQEQAAFKDTLSWRLTSPFRAISQRLMRYRRASTTTYIERSTAVDTQTIGFPENASRSKQANAESDNQQKERMNSTNYVNTSLSNAFHPQGLAYLLSLNGEEFIDCAYSTLLKRAPDQQGGALYLQQLFAGVAKIELLDDIACSDEGRRVGVGIPGLRASAVRPAASLTELLGADGELFVECAYLTFLNRQPDVEGANFYLGRLLKGVGKLQILDELSSSEEARRHGANIPGLLEAIARDRRSQRSLGRLFASFFSGKKDNTVDIRLSSLEQQLLRLAQHSEANYASLMRELAVLGKIDHVSNLSVPTVASTHNPAPKVAQSILWHQPPLVADSPSSVIAQIAQAVLTSAEAQQLSAHSETH